MPMAGPSYNLIESKSHRGAVVKGVLKFSQWRSVKVIREG